MAAGSKVQKEKRRRRLPQNISRKRKAVAWEAPQASSEVVARNQELREAYLKDPSSLSEEDRVRAKILVERSERKKKRRMKRKVSSKAVEKKEKEDKATKRASKERTDDEKALDWVCDKCNNNNWGRRDVCNTRSMKEREEGHFKEKEERRRRRRRRRKEIEESEV